jgi:hypothetical protein
MCMQNCLSRQLHAPATLPPRKKHLPPYLLDSSSGGPYSQSVCHGEEINLAPTWNRTPAVQSIACCYTDLSLCQEEQQTELQAHIRLDVSDLSTKGRQSVVVRKELAF